MTSEIVQFKESQPVISQQQIASKASGIENIAKVFGNIAERSINKAQDFADQASKANLLQTHGMLQDIEANSKIEMYRNPEHSEAISKNAQNAVDKIKNTARLNRADRLNLNAMADNTARGLNVTAAEKSIALTRERAKFNALSTLGDTIQSIRRDIFTNPEQADTLIAAQYETIAGLVSSGTITAVEAANIHKQFAAELDMARELVAGMREGVLDASDINTFHATATGNVPLNNADLPIAHDTALNADHHFGSLTINDIESRISNGARISPRELTSIKNISDLDKVLNYGAGAARATGDINSGKSWIELNHKLALLKKQEKLSAREEGYKNRLNNWINNAKEPGAYQNFIAGMPEGARAYQSFAEKQAIINTDVTYGTQEQIDKEKYIRTQDNWNELISKSDAIGIGMHYPDYLRQPIPLQLLTPIQQAFDKGGDVVSAIKNIQYLSPKNRVYAMNAFPDNPRKKMTVYEVGNLGDKGDPGFLIKLMESQQVDALTEKGKPKESQQKFLNLNQGKEGYSDKKLAARLTPALTNVTTYLSKQQDGGALVSAKFDQALRYVKKIASDHNDSNFEHLNDYIGEFARNMETAYGVATGFNYVLDNYSVPLEDNQKQVLASYALEQTRKKLLEYRTENEVDNIFVNRPPILVSSPGGRITVINPDGQAVADKHGQPAFSELYSEGIWRLAEHSIQSDSGSTAYNNRYGTPALNPEASAPHFLRAQTESIKPEVEGNIDLENRPKVWKNGRYETVKTITREFDGKTVLLPTIINGKEVSVKKATEHYINTGEHLGIFKDRESADKYDKQLHERMGWIGETNKWETK